MSFPPGEVIDRKAGKRKRRAEAQAEKCAQAPVMMAGGLFDPPTPICAVPAGYRLIPEEFRKRHATCHYCRVPTFKTFRLSKVGEYMRVPGGADDHSIDHKVPRSKGGSNAPGNRVHCCSDCNQEKGDADYAAFVEKKRGEKPER